MDPSVFPYIGTAVGTIVALIVAYNANKKSNVAQLEVKADKARSEYVGLLEKRIVVLEKQVQEIMADRERILAEKKRVEDDRDFYRREGLRKDRKIEELEAQLLGG